ncbi:MAG: hypothetical protein R3E64_09450 [Halioglobus sp.]
MANGYQYENKPRNIFRFALALWRVMRDPENTKEAGIVELTFNRSRWGKKLARWDRVAELVGGLPATRPGCRRPQKAGQNRPECPDCPAKQYPGTRSGET